MTATLADSRTDAFLVSAFEFVDRHPEQWDLAHDVELEVTNHVLRVWIQSGRIGERWHAVEELAARQHGDGGWGDRRDDPVSRMRTTSFATQMLLRALLERDDPEIRTVMERGIDFIVGRQREDGSWRDDRWHLLDATSVSVGTLIFARRLDSFGPRRKEALERGMAFVVSQQQGDGMWYLKPKASPVEITAHLLQKCGPYGSPREVVLPAMRGLLALQQREGHWDREDVDATCDAIRALMLTSARQGAELRPAVARAADRAVGWLLSLEREGGLAARPRYKPNVLFTCDAIDTALKYRQFQDDARDLVGFYS